jgi:hypothetical protein
MLDTPWNMELQWCPSKLRKEARLEANEIGKNCNN